MYLIVGTIYFFQDVREEPIVSEQDTTIETRHLDPTSDKVHAVTLHTTITYTWTISKNDILAWNLKKCT